MVRSHPGTGRPNRRTGLRMHPSRQLSAQVRLTTLQRYSRLIAEARNGAGVLTAITSAWLPDFADWAVAVSFRGSEEMPVVSAQASDPVVQQRLIADLSDTQSDLVQRLDAIRRSDADPDCTDPAALSLDAPLVIDGVVTGALVVGRADGSRRFTRRDCCFVQDVARLVANAVAWRRRYDENRRELRSHQDIELALRESETRFRTLANAGPVMIRQENDAGDIEYFNHPWALFTGEDVAVQTGRHWLELVHPADLDQLVRESARLQQSHTESVLDYRMRRADGEYRWITDRGVPRYSADGDFRGYIWSALDVSGQKRAEVGLRLLASTGEIITAALELHQLLQRFVELVTEAFADICLIELVEDNELVSLVSFSDRVTDTPDAQTAIGALLHRVASPLGRDAADRPDDCDELRTRHIVTGHCDDATLCDELEQAAITSVIAVRMEAYGRYSGVMTFATRKSARCAYDEDSKVLARTLAHRVAVVIDNARLYATAQIMEERYRHLFEGAADAIMSFDRELVIREVNPALTRLIRRTETQLIGSPVADLVVHQSSSWDAIFAALGDGEWRGEFALDDVDGTSIPVEAWITRTPLRQGSVYIAAMRDISERTSLEATRRTLLATVSHDLKNPINSIKANAQLALRKLRRDESVDRDRVEEAFSRIDGLTNRMVRQIDSLMDVALLDAGGTLELELGDVDLGALCQLVVDQQRATTTIHDIVVTLPEEPVIGRWDRSRIDRVITNLLTNAIKYSPDGGEIGIRLGRTIDGDGRAWAQIQVSDSGVGIPAADLPLIFSRFGRGKNVVSRFAGTGIGLVGASRIIGQHGGTISVESTEGVGSVFTIRLPLDPEGIPAQA